MSDRFISEGTELDNPITVGALYEEPTGDVIRVIGVTILEDSSVSVRLDDERKGDTHSVDATDVIRRLQAGEIERINSDHEAYMWRKQS